MAKVLLVLATVDTPLPTGQSFGGSYLFKINDSTARIAPEPQAEFLDVADGSYTGTCQALDTMGAPLGTSVSCSFTVATPAPGPAPSPTPAPGSTYPAPSSLSATVTY